MVDMRRVGKQTPTRIGDLFAVYKKKLQAPERSVIDAAIEVVHDLFGVSLERKHFSYTPYTKTLTIKASGILKTEISLKKEDILTHLKGRLGPQNAPHHII
jgi:hypothetical protein